MEIFNCGLDWLTLTNVVTDGLATPLMTHFSTLSDVTTKWRGGNGYKGRTDEYNGLRYASRSRKDGAADEMLVMSGNTADGMLDQIPGAEKYRATRIDLQMSLVLNICDEDLASKWYSQLMQRKRLETSVLGRRKVSLVQSDTGQTLYVGTRKTGRKFFRFYDKSNDVGHPLGTVWRQEIQYGRELAGEALARYTKIRGSKQAIIDLVCAEFVDCVGFTMLTPRNIGVGIETGPGREKTTTKTRLEWLERCVRPTIALLIEEGKEAEARASLGLRDR